MSASTISGIGYYTPIDDDAFEGDYPVSAVYATLLRNNVAHLMDSAGQFRINWLGQKGRADAVSFGTPTTTHYWTQSFPVTRLTKGGVTGLDIRIAACSDAGGETTSVTARIVYDVAPVLSALHLPLWTGSGSTASTTGAWVIDEDVQGIENDEWGKAWTRIGTTEDGTASDADVVMLRLEIAITGQGSTSCYLLGAMVREFPVWW